MFRKFISEFEENIKGLREFVELINPMLEEHHKSVAEEQIDCLKPIQIAINRHLEDDSDKKEQLDKEFKAIYDGEINVEIDEEKNLSFSIKGGDTESIDEALNKLGKTHFQEEQLYKNSLISLLSSVEWFLSQILHFHFDKYPDSAGINKKSITFEDLKTFDTIDDASGFLVDQKIESILRGSFKDWINTLKNELNLKLSFLDNYVNELTEVYQRRNLLIHNGGVVNSIYLSKVDKDIQKDIKLDDRLGVSKSYLEKSIDQFHLIFILIACELWKKLEPENDYRGKYAIEMGYDYLVKRNWKVARTANQFLIFDKKMPIANRTAAQLNVWLCNKEELGIEEAMKELKDIDYSDKSLVFQVALSALKGDKDFCFDNFKQLLKSEELSPQELLEFPIFREVREDNRFNEFCKSQEMSTK